MLHACHPCLLAQLVIAMLLYRLCAAGKCNTTGEGFWVWTGGLVTAQGQQQRPKRLARVDATVPVPRGSYTLKVSSMALCGTWGHATLPPPAVPCCGICHWRCCGFACQATGLPLLRPCTAQVDSTAQLEVGQTVALHYKGSDFVLAREM